MTFRGVGNCQFCNNSTNKYWSVQSPLHALTFFSLSLLSPQPEATSAERLQWGCQKHHFSFSWLFYLSLSPLTVWLYSERWIDRKYKMDCAFKGKGESSRGKFPFSFLNQLFPSLSTKINYFHFLVLDLKIPITYFCFILLLLVQYRLCAEEIHPLHYSSWWWWWSDTIFY